MEKAPEIHVRGDRFVTADGAPFTWVADTLWWGATSRVDDDEFAAIAELRASQGFTVALIVVGSPSDVAFADPRARNAGGRVWLDDGRPNHDYLEVAVSRVRVLAEAGLVPCVVGGWGYHIVSVGVERMCMLWDALFGLLSDCPVVWCAAGEALMPEYQHLASDDVDERVGALRDSWTAVLRHIRASDPRSRPLSIHPSLGVGHQASVDMVDASLLDFVMLQTGHDGLIAAPRSLAALARVRASHSGMPVLNAEVDYEGIMGANWRDVQRHLFWTHVLSGAAGHTYGAHGLWGFDRGSEGEIGYRWGSASWREALNYPGAQDVGRAARLLTARGWHDLTPDAAHVDAGSDAHVFAATAGESLVIYLPSPAMRLDDPGVIELVVTDTSGAGAATWVDPRGVQKDAPARFERVGEAMIFRGDVLGFTPTLEDWLLEVSTNGHR